jgi:cation diffusion facilitator CzcD-associated flavoprotein CzcO
MFQRYAEERTMALSADPGPEERTHAVVIVGTGFAGVGMAIALRKAGVRNFVILEKADRVGGTWRENTYPGCACDIRSHLYSFSFEPKSDWTREFAPQPEILGYIEHCVAKYGLAPHIRFHTEVTGAEYDEASAAWQVNTASGAVIRGKALVIGQGPLHIPNVPELPGLERFEGRAFHSAQWDHDYDLTGKKVAVIGTGASAIQFVPQIAEQTAHLTVFQRTAPWIMPRPDRAFTAKQKDRFQRIPLTRVAHRNAIYWLQESFVLGFEHPKIIKAAERLGQAHIARQVADPALRAKLTPPYTLGCKRTLVSSDYYPVFNRADVSLETEGIAEIREHSILTKDGREIEVDAIIFGTGFHVTDAMAKAHLVGRDGLKITEWAACAWWPSPRPPRSRSSPTCRPGTTHGCRTARAAACGSKVAAPAGISTPRESTVHCGRLRPSTSGCVCAGSSRPISSSKERHHDRNSGGGHRRHHLQGRQPHARPDRPRDHRRAPDQDVPQALVRPRRGRRLGRPAGARPVLWAARGELTV